MTDPSSNAFGLRREISGSSPTSVIRRICFGDRIGEIAFLASLLLFMVYWVVEWRINDSLALLNAMDAMAGGQLYYEEAVYGSGVDTPGAHIVGDRVYGRNYGILTIGLVPLGIIKAVSVVVDLRIAFAGLWSLGVLALSVSVGHLVGRRRIAVYAGGAAALALFALNVATATNLDPAESVLYALQFTHLLIAAFGAVFAYRLLRRQHDVRTGAFGAMLVAVGTPMGLWATIAKRHVITATVVLTIAFLLYRSRTVEDGEKLTPLQFRAIAYAIVGLLAWVHAPEALLVFVVLVAVDLPTARQTDLRGIGVLVGTLFISLVPFLVTNYLISGSPVKPPRMLSGGSLSGGGGGSAGILAPIQSLFAPLEALVGIMSDSLSAIISSPGLMVPVFIRSGTVERVASSAHHVSVNLSLLEASPLLAALSGVVPAAYHRIRTRTRPLDFGSITPNRTVDLFLGTFCVLFVLLYMFRLPIHAQITVRYLFPIVPALAILIVRLPQIRLVVRDHWKTFVWSVTASVLIGGQLLLVTLVILDPGLGEAFQFHALLSLSIAALLAIWALGARSDRTYGKVGAILLGLATAASILFLLLVSIEYYSLGDRQLLPIVRALGERVSIV